MKIRMVALSFFTAFGISSQALANDNEKPSKDLGSFYTGVDIGFIMKLN